MEVDGMSSSVPFRRRRKKAPPRGKGPIATVAIHKTPTTNNTPSNKLNALSRRIERQNGGDGTLMVANRREEKVSDDELAKPAVDVRKKLRAGEKRHLDRDEERKRETSGEYWAVFTSPQRMKKMRIEPDAPRNHKQDLPAPLDLAPDSRPMETEVHLEDEVFYLQTMEGSRGCYGQHTSTAEAATQCESQTLEPEPDLVGRTLQGLYQVIQLLGRGNFSTTYLAESVPPTHSKQPQASVKRSRLLAVKRVNGEWLNPMGLAEYEILKELHGGGNRLRHIITPVTAFYDEQRIFHLVLESLDSARPVSLPEDCLCSDMLCSSYLTCPSRLYRFQKLILQLLTGLHELHRQNIIHTDLTPENILYMPASNRIKIIDLGNAVRVEEVMDHQKWQQGDWELQSAHYRAPEILLGAGPVWPVMDIWGAGIIGLEWFLGTDGRRELEREIDAQWGKSSGNAVNEERVAGQPVMAVRQPSRTEMVMRMAMLFGSVEAYRDGVFYKPEYEGLASLTSGNISPAEDEYGLCPPDAKNLYRQGNGILQKFLYNMTGSRELINFISDMLTVNVWERKTAVQMLRNRWFAGSLLGDWANILAEDSQVHGQQVDDEAWVRLNDDSGFAESIGETGVNGRDCTQGSEKEMKHKVQDIPEAVQLVNGSDSIGSSPSSEAVSIDEITSGTTTGQCTGAEQSFLANVQDSINGHSDNSNVHFEGSYRQPQPRRPRFFEEVEDIDNVFSFISPTSFPFTYKRFCPSPISITQPPLPVLFQSPSPPLMNLLSPSPPVLSPIHSGRRDTPHPENQPHLTGDCDVDTVEEHVHGDIIPHSNNCAKAKERGQLEIEIPPRTVPDEQELIDLTQAKAMEFKEQTIGGNGEDDLIFNTWHMDLASSIQGDSYSDEEDELQLL